LDGVGNKNTVELACIIQLKQKPETKKSLGKVCEFNEVGEEGKTLQCRKQKPRTTGKWYVTDFDWDGMKRLYPLNVLDRKVRFG
jgi:hypothetical protein